VLTRRFGLPGLPASLDLDKNTVAGVISRFKGKFTPQKDCLKEVFTLEKSLCLHDRD